MAAEDALYRSMRPTAETLVRQRQRKHVPVDADQLVEETLEQFRAVIDFAEHAAALRVRLKQLIVELAKPRRGPSESR
jgi:hypothetical protein